MVEPMSTIGSVVILFGSLIAFASYFRKRTGDWRECGDTYSALSQLWI